MKNYKILSKAILAICLFGIILTIINSFTGFINSSISTSGTIICISSFIVAGVAIMLLENRRIKTVKEIDKSQLCAQLRVCNQVGGNPIYPRSSQPDNSESWDVVGNSN